MLVPNKGHFAISGHGEGDVIATSHAIFTVVDIPTTVQGDFNS